VTRVAVAGLTFTNASCHVGPVRTGTASSFPSGEKTPCSGANPVAPAVSCTARSARSWPCPPAAILQAGLSAYLTRHEVKTPKLTREQPQRSARTAKVAHDHVPLAGP
jgi:hypothetical protein